MSQIVTDFLTRCFAPEETIALLLRKENGERPAQRIVRLEQALAPTYLRWLAHENHNGANVYVAANPLRPGSRRRTKESVAEVRHLYIDIDADGEARVAALLASDAVPTPTAILSTSPNKYQVLWRVDGFDFEPQESTLKLLASAFGRIPLRFGLESRRLSARHYRAAASRNRTANSNGKAHSFGRGLGLDPQRTIRWDGRRGADPRAGFASRR
jgi:hypothetical protein